MIPNNEFSEQFTADMPSSDVMMHNYLKYYTENTCARCGLKFWRKKELTASICCGKCDNELQKQINEGSYERNT